MEEGRSSDTTLPEARLATPQGVVILARSRLSPVIAEKDEHSVVPHAPLLQPVHRGQHHLTSHLSLIYFVLKSSLLTLASLCTVTHGH